ncbi:MAG TPA: hypothetical protein VFY54_23360, partial [Rubrobacter sp.]|nr:hypothetical protein [Rubrobacter sp.]
LHPSEQQSAAAAALHTEPGPLQQLNVLAVAPNALPQTVGEQQAAVPVAPCVQPLPAVTQVGLGAAVVGTLRAMH